MTPCERNVNMVVSKGFLVRRIISRYNIVTFFILKEREKAK